MGKKPPKLKEKNREGLGRGERWQSSLAGQASGPQFLRVSFVPQSRFLLPKGWANRQKDVSALEELQAGQIYRVSSLSIPESTYPVWRQRRWHRHVRAGRAGVARHRAAQQPLLRWSGSAPQDTPGSHRTGAVVPVAGRTCSDTGLAAESEEHGDVRGPEHSEAAEQRGSPGPRGLPSRGTARDSYLARRRFGSASYHKGRLPVPWVTQRANFRHVRCWHKTCQNTR